MARLTSSRFTGSIFHYPFKTASHIEFRISLIVRSIRFPNSAK
jgi:hypothetical protein